jgi:hypothetical protein
MTEIEYWVLHSPYPDKTWRGIEKCATENHTSPLMFESKEEAQEFMYVHKCDPHFVPVKVTLVVPSIRGLCNE